MIIYKITNKINNKIYIGQTTKSIEERFREHLNCARRNDIRHLYRAINKYGKENFIIETIDSANSLEELNRKEQYWIEKLNTIEFGYNMKGSVDNPMNYPEGKANQLKQIRSKEVRERISKSLSNYRKENGFTKEHLEKIKNKLRGNKNFSGHKRSEYAKQVTREIIQKKVYCLDKNGNILKRFESVKSAALWWYDYDGFTIKYPEELCNSIKKSYREDIYIRSLKWIYE